ncbi:pyocin S6 family toxin immunity protein [Pseudomonas sp. SIMBA_077]
MKLRLTGFLPEPTHDDRVKYKIFFKESLENSALTIMGWAHLDEALGGEQELTADQAIRFAELLDEPQLVSLTLFIGCVA